MRKQANNASIGPFGVAVRKNNFEMHVRILHTSKSFSTFAPTKRHVRPRVIYGKMPEWSIGAVSKTVVPLRAPRVRIPVFRREGPEVQASDLRAKKGGMRTLMGSLSCSACVARIPVFPQKDTG